MTKLTKLVTPTLAKRRALPTDQELRKRAIASELRHTVPGVGDPDRRIVIGEIDLPKFGGRIHVEHDQGSDEVVLHDVRSAIGDISPASLRSALYSASSAFSNAENAEEQVTARNLVAAVVSAVLSENPDLTAAVRQRLQTTRA